MQSKPCKTCKHHYSAHGVNDGACSIPGCPCRKHTRRPHYIARLFDGPIPSDATLARVCPADSWARRVVRALLTGVADPAPYLPSGPYVSDKAFDRVLEACNTVLGAHGVEPLRDGKCRRFFGDVACLYLNTGDTYTTTLLFDVDTDRIHITSWGDWVERHEKQFRDC